MTRTRTDDTGTTIARNDVTVMLGTGGGKHVFYIATNEAEFDALEVAEEAVAAWADYLSGRGLLP